jgi:hypothetical protein
MQTFVILLAVVVIILLLLAVYYYLYFVKQQPVAQVSNFAEAPDIDLRRSYSAYEWAKVKEDNAQSMVNQLLAAKQNAGNLMVDENLAYFAHSACPRDGESDYAVEKYGDKGTSYMDWLGGNLISPEMEKNHQEYISKDIALIGVGRAMSYDQNDSYNPVDWTGLRRPQNVPFSGTADQIADMDHSIFMDRSTILF